MASRLEEGVGVLPSDDGADLDERLRAAGVRLASGSMDRPRVVVRPRPAWLALLLRTIGWRG